MLSDKPMRIRLAFSGAVFLSLLGVLYLELWIDFWFPSGFAGGVWLFTALAGGLFWAWTLPHPRQERKKREKLLRLKQEQLKEVTDSTLLMDEEETLAEKRP